MSAVFPVNEDPRWRIHDASPGQTVFAIPYAFQDATDITVVKIAPDGARTELSQPADYTVTGAGNPSGGSYTLAVPAQAGEKYLNFGDAEMARTSSVVRMGKFSSVAIDEDLDRALIRDLELRRDVNRALKMDIGEGGLTVEPVPEGHFWKAGAGGRMVDGGSAEDIINAQGHAAEAKDARDVAVGAQEVAEDAAARAESAASGVEYPVSYKPQTLTPEQQEQARENIGVDYLTVADRTALKALDPSTTIAAYLTEKGREGQFTWDGSDLSSIILGPEVTSTGVSGDIITSEGHALLLGDAVLVTSAVNGLSTNTLYWVIHLSPDTFSLASSYEAAVAGTAVTLTGTNAMTVKRHLDPREGLFVCPASDLSGSSGAWLRQAGGLVERPGRVNVLWFGAKGDKTTYDDGPLISAFRAVTSDLWKSVNQAGPVFLYSAGVVYLPKGRYLVRPNKLDLTGLYGLSLEGDGARIARNSLPASTSIIVDGTGTTSSDWMIRNLVAFSASKVSFEYTNSFAGDILVGVSGGVYIDLCSFNSDVFSGPRPYTANSAIRFWTGHFFDITRSTFGDLNTCIIIDNETGANTNQWRIEGNVFNDCTHAFIECKGNAVWGLAINGNSFDPVLKSPEHGLLLTAHGFTVHGNAFYYSNSLYAPANEWIKLVGSVGSIVGNRFSSSVPDSWAVVIQGGQVDFRANFVTCTNGVSISGAQSIVTGGGNRFTHAGSGTEDVVVLFTLGGASMVDWNMDIISSGFKNSYVTNSASTAKGKIRYNSVMDGSTDKVLATTSYPEVDDGT